MIVGGQKKTVLAVQPAGERGEEKEGNAPFRSREPAGITPVW